MIQCVQPALIWIPLRPCTELPPRAVLVTASEAPVDNPDGQCLKSFQDRSYTDRAYESFSVAQRRTDYFDAGEGIYGTK